MEEILEHSLEIINGLIAVGIAVVGLRFLQQVRFDLQRRAIKLFLGAILLFAATEILAVMNFVLASAMVELYKECAETGSILCIAVGLYYFRQSDLYEVAVLHRSAVTDALTGLSNQAFLSQAGRQRVNEARLRGNPLTLLILDIDDFKAYNDRYGHEAGNLALRCVASTLMHCTRRDDLVARYGGDEFVVLTGSSLGDSVVVAERIREKIGVSCSPETESNLRGSTTVSIGVAALTDQTTIGDLLEAADLELYRAKRTGKNRVTVVAHSTA